MDSLTIVIILLTVYFLFGQKEGLGGKKSALQKLRERKKKHCSRDRRSTQCKKLRARLRKLREQRSAPVAVGHGVSEPSRRGAQPTARKARAIGNLLEGDMVQRIPASPNAVTVRASEANALQLDGRDLQF